MSTSISSSSSVTGSSGDEAGAARVFGVGSTLRASISTRSAGLTVDSTALKMSLLRPFFCGVAGTKSGGMKSF